jgi:hypothetical protein
MNQRTIIKYGLLSLIVTLAIYPSACLSWGVNRPTTPVTAEPVPTSPSPSPTPSK